MSAAPGSWCSWSSQALRVAPQLLGPLSREMRASQEASGQSQEEVYLGGRSTAHRRRAGCVCILACQFGLSVEIACFTSPVGKCALQMRGDTWEHRAVVMCTVVHGSLTATTAALVGLPGAPNGTVGAHSIQPGWGQQDSSSCP